MHCLTFYYCTDKCEYLGTTEQVAADEGDNVATSKTGSLEECEKLCDATNGCNSFSYAPPPSYEMVNCYLKDKIITNSDKMEYKKDWTTYYRQCTSCK